VRSKEEVQLGCMWMQPSSVPLFLMIRLRYNCWIFSALLDVQLKFRNEAKSTKCIGYFLNAYLI